MALTTVDGALLGTNATPQLNGVQFPATQVPSSDANTLDDYEEGTWTPTVQGSSSNPTVGYAVRYGYYTKVGNRVMFNLYVQLNSISGGSGTFQVTLPFAASGGVVAVACYLNRAQWGASRTQVVGIIYNNSVVYFESIGNNMSNASLAIGDFSGDEDFSLCGHFFVS